jgi:hypothetical protein
MARIALQNQKNLANYGIMQNLAREIKDEQITNREAVRDEEARNAR